MDMLFNGRSCLRYYGLTLESCYLSAARRKQQLIDIPGADGQLDLLNGWGEPTYRTRTLTAVFSVTVDRESVIRRLIHDLQGRTVPIVLPGYWTSYMIGTVHIGGVSLRNDSSLNITAECDPWLYSSREKIHTFPASADPVPCQLSNHGRKTVVPEITVTESDAAFTLSGETVVLSPGIHTDARFSVSGGRSLDIAVSGGAVTMKYREAVLL